MKLSTYGGIDYSAGTPANRGEKARYGVIPLNDLCEHAVEDILYGPNSTDVDFKEFIESCRSVIRQAVRDWLECNDEPDIAVVIEESLVDWSDGIVSRITEIAIDEIEGVGIEPDDVVIERIVNQCEEECCFSDSYEQVGDCTRVSYESPTIKGHTDSGGDMRIYKSPFVTWAQFCSPCAPGAGYLRTPCVEGVGTLTYCLPNGWYPDGECPYPYWNVETGEKVFTPIETTE